MSSIFANIIATLSSVTFDPLQTLYFDLYARTIFSTRLDSSTDGRETGSSTHGGVAGVKLTFAKLVAVPPPCIVDIDVCS